MTPLPDRSAEWNANPCKPRRKHDPATRYQRRWQQEKKRNHRRPRPDIPEAEIIIAEVAAKHGFNVFVMQQLNRKRVSLTRAKREACVRLRDELKLSYPTIAALLGWVNHSTAILAEREGRSVGRMAKCFKCDKTIYDNVRRVSAGGFLMDFHEPCFVELFGDLPPTDERVSQRTGVLIRMT